ncbi:MAG: hypothetical protein ACPHO8_02000, partial [Mariniblastus sp.]
MTLMLDSKDEQLGQREPDFSQLAMEQQSASFFGGLNLTTIKFEDEEYEYEDEEDADEEYEELEETDDGEYEEEDGEYEEEDGEY